MRSPATRLLAFGVALVAAFGLGAGAGAVLGDDPPPPSPTPATTTTAPEHGGHDG